MKITTATTKEQCIQAAQLHRQYIASGFLSSLGDRTLGVIYRFIATDSQSVLIIALQDEQVVGFVSGTIDVDKFYKRFMAKNILFGFNILPKIFSPKRMKRLIETLLYPSKNKEQNLPPAELLSIVVDREFQGQGISQQLYQKLVEFFQAKEVSEFKIIVGAELLPAIHFYRKMGAGKLSEIEVHKGSKSWVMYHKLK